MTVAIILVITRILVQESFHLDNYVSVRAFRKIEILQTLPESDDYKNSLRFL